MDGIADHPVQGDADLAAFAETARRAVAACAGLDPRAQVQRLAEDGLLGLLAPEEADGLGLGLRHAVPVMQQAGAGLLGAPLMEGMLLAAALAANPAGPAIAAGEMVATIAWAGTVASENGRLHGTAGRAPGAEGCDAVLVRTADGAALVRLSGGGASLSDGLGIDVDLPEYEVVLDGAAPVATLDADAFARLCSDALVLRAAAILGSVDACLAMACEHTATRQQFGRPLVAFQALRHALARQKLSADGIRGAIARCVGLDDPAGRDAVLARQAAFAAAARLGPAALESALQLHGGMGFTWDIPVHRHLRQVRSWEAQGDAAGVHRAIADTLLDANT